MLHWPPLCHLTVLLLIHFNKSLVTQRRNAAEYDLWEKRGTNHIKSVLLKFTFLKRVIQKQRGENVLLSTSFIMVKHS